MGDPKFTKRKFSTPPHPWQKSRIDEEKQLIKEYGLKNKSEIWKMGAKAKKFADQAKMLTAKDTAQSKKEEEQLLTKLYVLDLLPKGAGIDAVLGITVKDILERRLQTIVFRKGFARSITQARQFITHRHVAIGSKVITAPSYIVPASEEERVLFIQKSALSDPDHPERAVKKEFPSGRIKKEEKKGEQKKITAPKKKAKEEAKPAEEKPAEKPKEKKEEAEKEPKEETKEDKKE